MLDWINHAILVLADPLLNWLLRLPTDSALVIVAVGTGPSSWPASSPPTRTCCGAATRTRSG